MDATHIHVKTGGLYRIVTLARREADLEPMVVYQNVSTGQTWVRPDMEFFDGRFRSVSAQESLSNAQIDRERIVTK